jgi:hypothetical protein
MHGMTEIGYADGDIYASGGAFLDGESAWQRWFLRMTLHRFLRIRRPFRERRRRMI